MKIKPFIYGLLFTFVMVACSSCDDNDIPSAEQYKRTVLVYMAADNNLSSFGYTNIQSMIAGVTTSGLNNGNLLVYFDPADDVPQLLQITVNKQGAVVKQVIKTYSEQNSASKEVVSAVINEVINDSRFKADSYGLMLWSHGTAWLPSTYKNLLKSFGQDGSNWMEIPELAEAIPDHVFDFIIFDACYMSSIEVVYSLRNKADYIMGSPTEIMGSGFPYNLIMEPLFKENVDLVGIGDTFFNYYDKQSGLWRSATISIIDTKGLDALRNAARTILQGKESEIKAMSLSDVQFMDYLTSSKRMLYDFDDFIKHVASDSDYNTFTSALAKTVVYKKTTPNSTYGLGGGIAFPMTRFSGLNSYIPQAIQTGLNEWYTRLDWYKAVY